MNKINDGATIWARQTIDSDIFYKKPDKWFKIWFYIVNKVNHGDNKQFKRGQGFFKYEWIQEKTAATSSEIDHCIRWLKSAKQIATQKATRGMIITVLQYDLYQNFDTYKSDTKSDTIGETKAKQKRNKSDTINNNDNNDNNNTTKKNKKTPVLPLEQENKNSCSLSDNCGNCSKCSLVPCTDLQLWEIAKKEDIWIQDVRDKHSEIMDLIDSGEFQKRYKKHKTVYRTLQRWLKMGISRGYIQKMNEFQKMCIDDEHPEKKRARRLLIQSAKEQGIL